MGWFTQPVSTKAELIAFVTKEALRMKLDPALACAIVEQESNWDPWAIRYEPGFMNKYVAPIYAAGKIDATEAYARSISWGLFQIMGQVAREAGFDGKFLAELCDPQTNAGVGCYVFGKKLMTANGDVTKGLLAWNGGGNTQYPIQVLNRLKKYQTNGASK
jgi:soluble lytic murein transglycosylase-like protein